MLVRIHDVLIEKAVRTAVDRQLQSAASANNGETVVVVDSQCDECCPQRSPYHHRQDDANHQNEIECECDCDCEVVRPVRLVQFVKNTSEPMV